MAIMASPSFPSKGKGLTDDEKSLISDKYGRITHYFEKSKCLDINVDVDVEYQHECKFAINFFQDEQIKTFSSKLRKISLWIECGSFLAVNLWNKMENIVKLLCASKCMIHDLNIFLTHDENIENNNIKTRQYLFDAFMQLIVESSTYKLNFINFNIDGIEKDLNEIYISYLIKLLMPSNKKQKHHITSLKLSIFGNDMFHYFCDEKNTKNKRFPYAIIATSTLKSLSITFENICINHKMNTFLHCISLNNYISSLSFCINDRGNFKNNKNTQNINNLSIITSFYVTLYAIFSNKWKHLHRFCLEYCISRREYKYNNDNNMSLCKLDNAELMKKYVLQPIINKAKYLKEFEWRIDMKWNEINLYPLCILFESDKHDFEFISISKIYTSNQLQDIHAMTRYLTILKKSNRCQELKLSGLDGKLFTELLCNFIARDCGSTFEILRFRMKYDVLKDIYLLDKHVMLILNSFISHLEYLYKMYEIIIPDILSEYNDNMLPQYLIAVIRDFCKMRGFKLDFSLLMDRKIRQPLSQNDINDLEEILSGKINGLMNKLQINTKGDYEPLVIKKDDKNNHPLLRQLFQTFIQTPNVNLHFTAIDCKLLFSINP